jgi:transcriptional regulator with XRE-family HTH domain
MPALSASSVGVSTLSMPAMLQNANLSASANICIPRDDGDQALLHNATMVDDVDIRSGNLLRAWREHRRMTQAELAQAVGTTAAVISLLESGDRKLSPKWLHRLAPPLNTSPGYLLDIHPDDVSQDIIDTWAAIPIEQRTVVRDVLKAFTHRNGTDG